MDFTTILGKAEIRTIPKIWKKWISIVREKYGKTQIFQSMGFSNILGEAEIHTISKIQEKWIYVVGEK